MTFAQQITEDFEKVFLNSDEFADVIIIDGVEQKGFYSKKSGEYDEEEEFLRVSAQLDVSETSSIVIDGKTYGVVSISEKNGEKIILLGEAL